MTSNHIPAPYEVVSWTEPLGAVPSKSAPLMQWRKKMFSRRFPVPSQHFLERRRHNLRSDYLILHGLVVTTAVVTSNWSSAGVFRDVNKLSRKPNRCLPLRKICNSFSKKAVRVRLGADGRISPGQHRGSREGTTLREAGLFSLLSSCGCTKPAALTPSKGSHSLQGS